MIAAAVPGAEPRRRLSAEDRRVEIVEAARRTFARRGFHGTGTAEIAAAAGCSEPTLYKHFASKQALFVAALTYAGVCMRRQVAEFMAGRDDDPLAALVEFQVTKLANEEYAEIIRLRSLAVTLADDPEIRAVLVEMATSQRTWVARWLRAGQEAGSVRTDFDTELAGWLAVALSQLASFRHASEGDVGLADMAPIVQGFAALLAPLEGASA